jgi:hypothetical protein
MDEATRNENGSSGGMNLIDLAVRQSSAELKKLVNYYKQIGRTEEARKIDETLNRLGRKNVKSEGNSAKRLDH